MFTTKLLVLVIAFSAVADVINGLNSPLLFKHLFKKQYQKLHLQQSNKIRTRNVETNYLEQRIDNYDPSNYNTFQQVNFKFFSHDPYILVCYFDFK